MNVDLGMRATGEVTMVLTGPEGDESRHFANVVLDRGWNSMVKRSGGGEGAMVPRWLHFGSGDSEPQASDAGLERRAAHTARQSAGLTYGGRLDATTLTAYSEVMVRFEYPPGTITGTWSELGLSYDQGYTEPFNRALVRDEDRVPVPLIVLSDQHLTVYVRLRLHFEIWSRRLDLSQYFDGMWGVLNMRSGIASSTANMWRYGFPVYSAVMGGATGLQEGLDLENPGGPTVKQYFAIGPGALWDATSIVFRGLTGAEMLSLDFDPRLSKPPELAASIRVRLTIKRG